MSCAPIGAPYIFPTLPCILEQFRLACKGRSKLLPFPARASRRNHSSVEGWRKPEVLLVEFTQLLLEALHAPVELQWNELRVVIHIFEESRGLRHHVVNLSHGVREDELVEDMLRISFYKDDQVRLVTDTVVNHIRTNRSPYEETVLLANSIDEN